MAQTHTASEQWQSFEMRMRHRRVERCLLRASAALDNGLLDEARELCSEIERLEPHNPDLEPVRARLDSISARPIVEARKIEAPKVEARRIEAPKQVEAPKQIETLKPIETPKPIEPPKPIAPPKPIVARPGPVLVVKEFKPVVKEFTPIVAKPKPVAVVEQPKPIATKPAAVLAVAATEPVAIASEPAVVERRSSRRWLAAAAVFLILVSGAAGWLWTRSLIVPSTVSTDAVPSSRTVASTPPRQPEDPPAPPSPTAVTTPAENAPAAADPIAASASRPADVSTPVAETVVNVPSAPRSETARVEPIPSPPPAEVSRATLPPVPQPRVEPDAVTASRPAGETFPVVTASEPSLPVTPVPTPATGGVSLAGTAVDVREASVPAPSPAPAPAADPSAARAADEKLIRTVLARYEAAYNRLDAAAAAAVWPSADRRGLSHAFNGLASQSVSLGKCDVRVGNTTAEATCTGMHRWSPKVGGKAETSARRWNFELRSTDGNWVISQVSVR